MENNINSELGTMPKQKLAQSKKTDDWGKQCIDGVISMANNTGEDGRSSRYKKQVNYDLINSKFDETDFQYVLNPYGVQDTVGNAPGRLRNFNIIVNKLNTLKGEEIKRPFNFRVIAVNGEAITAREERKKEAILTALQEELAVAIGTKQPELDPQGNPIPPKSIESLSKWYDQSYSDIREQMGNQVLQYLLEKEKLKLKFNKGFEHANIVAEEIYYVGIDNGEPVCRVVNPLNFFYDKNPDLDVIEDAQWAMEERFMSVGQVIDEYGDFLTEDQLEKLDTGQLGGNRNNLGMQPGFVYEGKEVVSFKPAPGQSNGNMNSGAGKHISVIICVWKSMRKMGFVSYIDEHGEKQETIVDDTFKVPAYATWDKIREGYVWDDIFFQWSWINEVWKGTKIGNDFYVDINPLPNQCRSMENPYECKLPYVGRVYNNLNSVATSLVDLMKPHQYLYNIIWFRLETEIAKAKGKAFLMDLAMLPKSHGIDLEKWMYYFDNLGVAYVNSMEEGREGDPNTVSKFNQFTQIDRSVSQSIAQYIVILNKLEEMVGTICGINRQREGQASPAETATGVQANLVQSSHITEPIFYIHNEVKKQVLTQLLEAAKIAYVDGKKTQYILDDMYRVMLQVDGEMFNDSDYGVFVSDAQKDNVVMEKLQQLAQVALQNEQLNYKDIIKIFKSNSISEIENTLTKSAEEKQAIAEKAQQAELQNQQLIAKQQIEAQRESDAREDARNTENNETKVKVAEIGALGFSKDTDTDTNGIPDVLEVEKLRQKDNIDRTKLGLDKYKVEVDAQQKERDRLESERQRQHELKMQNKDLNFKEKELNKKDKTERFKAKMKPKTPPKKKK